MTKNAVVGISSFALNDKEIDLFLEHTPYGIILFKRNCQNEAQLRSLIDSIKKILPECKVFIDQEGGRVARLKQPNFIEFPAAKDLSEVRDVYSNYNKMGKYLKKLGVDINCAPMADLYYPYADNIIGDRSFGGNVEQVVNSALAAANGLIDAGITPIIKHIPGHGRALVDSHFNLPIIDTELSILEETDFAVFKALNHLPMAMTAHVVYDCLDKENPVTISKESIDYIRNKIGFKGIIIGDDIDMKSLNGSINELTSKVINAGCDLVLHCNGEFDKTKEVLEAINYSS